MNNTTQYERGIIVKGGMGAFLNPPTHPSHNYHVETDLKRKKANRSTMELSYSLTKDYLHPDTKKEVQELLTKWELSKPDLNTPEMQNWIKQVFAHLGESKGVFFIRIFYPDFKNNII